MLDEQHPDSLTLKKTRSFFGLFRELFQFLKLDAGLFLQPLAQYSLSLLMLAIVLASYFFQRSPSVENIYFLKNAVPKQQYLLVVINSLMYLASISLFFWVVIRALLLREEHPNEPPRILRAVFRKNFKQGLTTYALNFLIIYVLYVLTNYLLPVLSDALWFSDSGALSVYPLNDKINLLIGYLLPLVLYSPVFYFGFAGLYLSVRDNMGITEAFKRVHELSSQQYLRIWLQVVFMLILAHYTEKISGELLFGVAKLLGTQNNLVYFLVISLKKLLGFAILFLLQLSTIFLFSSVEAGTVQSTSEDTSLNS